MSNKERYDLYCSPSVILLWKKRGGMIGTVPLFFFWDETGGGGVRRAW